MPQPLHSSPPLKSPYTYIHYVLRPILFKLEVEALIRCQCVCKEWRSIIQHPHFKLSYRGRRLVLTAAYGSSLTFTSLTSSSLHIKTLFQVSEYPSSPDTFSSLYYCWWSGVWCSCNGLVLFSMGKHIFLWNPSTRCCIKVLELGHLSNQFPGDVVSGLCYLPSTGDYKVVLLFCFDATVMIASLKNKEWRKVPFPCHGPSTRDVVNFHNTLHWRASDSMRRPDKIIYFEAESNEFKELPTPELQGGKRAVVLGLGIMDGCICMASEGKERGERGEKVLQVLVMKESWVTQFVISSSASELLSFDFRTTILYSSKCNTKVLICSCCCGFGEILVCDVKNNKMDNHFSEGSKYYADAICSYVQSFVSPHEFIWTDTNHRRMMLC